MKRVIAILLSFVATSALYAGPTTDVYDFKMRVMVPRIYDNTESRGQRKWQTQIIYGQMLVDYNTDDLAPRITFENCINRTHVINGKHVTYMCEEGYDDVIRRWVVMGSNKTGTFKYGSCFFFAGFDPSYNIGDDEPDNSLLLYFGGYGNLQKVGSSACSGAIYKVRRWSGYCVGTMGCGCRAYGHTSPTRVLGFYGPVLSCVTDVAAIPKGQWYATYRYSF